MLQKPLIVTGSLVLAFLAGRSLPDQPKAPQQPSPYQLFTFTSADGESLLYLFSEVIGGVPGEAKPRRIQAFEAHLNKELQAVEGSYSGRGPEYPLPPALAFESGAGTFVIAPKSGNWDHVIEAGDLVMTFDVLPAPAQGE